MPDTSAWILVVLIFAPVVFWWIDSFLQSPITKVFYGLTKTIGAAATALAVFTLSANLNVVYDLLGELVAVLRAGINHL